MNFCKETMMLLEEITSGELIFKSIKTGTTYKALPEHTMLASENIGESQSSSKFKNTLKVAAQSFIEARARIPEGCEKCSRKIVTLQRLGEDKKVFYSCVCGNQWSI